MSISAKQALSTNIEEQIGDFLTVTQTRKVKAVVDDALSGFEVEEITAPNVNTDMLDIFLKAKSVEGKSNGTINRYSYLLEKLIIGVGKPAELITTNDIRDYIAEEKERGLSDRSLEGMRCAYSSFFGWLYREGLIRKNPVNNIGTIKFEKTVKEPFTAAEMEKLKFACKKKRDLTIVNFLRCTGCRIGEMEKLNRNDVDLINKTCIVRGKGKKQRRAYIDDITAELLTDYLNSRTDDSPALFISRLGNRFSAHSVQSMLRDLGMRAGVKNVHPHRFRHTRATYLDSIGLTMNEIAAVLGHESIETTAIYITTNQETIEGKIRRFA